LSWEQILTLKLIRYAIELSKVDEIAVIDMAPSTATLEARRIGGRLDEMSDLVKQVVYLAPTEMACCYLSL